MAKKSLKKDYNRFLLSSLVFLTGISFAKGDSLRDGREAFMNYDFDLASEYYEKYAKSLKKTPSEEGEKLLDKYLRQLEIAENSLENVQKIEIIDRIDVPLADFYKAIKLPPSGGKLLSHDVSVLNKRNNQSDFAFSSEEGDFMMWSENDQDQREVIMQSERLMDGSWEKPSATGEVLNDNGNARNPFLLTDGLTLYYSSDGDGSMGGYDLFVATKDPISGEFRQPIGLGYPFNSPYNEYMMAVDEENGIGWWVTDRNMLDGQVSVYIFKTNDVRKNYVPEEEEDIISLAKISDISKTQNPDTDYAAILKGIDERHSSRIDSSNPDFIFPLPNGKVAKRFSDFTDSNAKRTMQQYLEALNEQDILEETLLELRKKFHYSDKNKVDSEALKNQILELESKRESQVERLKKMRNTIISAEIKQ